MSTSSLITAARPALILMALTLSAGPLLAQDRATSGQTGVDPVAALLRDASADPAAPAAPTAEPDPEERVTRALNAETLAQSELTDRERQAQADEEQARYQAQLSAAEAEAARLRAVAEDNEAAYQAALAHHERAMADWRATAEACRRGQTTRCRAGKAPALPGT